MRVYRLDNRISAPKPLVGDARRAPHGEGTRRERVSIDQNRSSVTALLLGDWHGDSQGGSGVLRRAPSTILTEESTRMNFQTMNIWAILVATIVAFVLGGL